MPDKVPPHDVVQDIIAPCHAGVLRELRPFLLSLRTKPVYNTIKMLLDRCELYSRNYCKNCEKWLESEEAEEQGESNEDLPQRDD